MPTSTPTTTSTPTPSTTPATTTTQTTMIPSTICPTFPPLSNVGAPQLLNHALVNLGCGGKDDIVFLVDSSTHVLSSEERVFQLFTNAFVDSLQVGPQKARVGYAYYNSRVNEILHLDRGSYLDSIDRIFSSLEHYRTVTQDRAYLGSAINHVLGDMYSGRYSRSGAKRHIVILTGNAIDDLNQAVAAADKARSRGIDVIVVAVGNIRNIETQLHRVSSSPSSQYFLNVKDFSSLQPELESLILSHCRGNNPLPTIASDPCAGPKLLNYLGCGAREDITLILDRSGSIRRTDWAKMNQFIQQLVGKFDVSPHASRIGMMTFNSMLLELIHFKDFSDRNRLLSDINYQLSRLYPTGNTMTHLALERTLQWYKQDSSPDAIKVAVIFTDGKSSSKFDTLASALELQRNNVSIFVVGIGSNIDLQEQMILASDPDSEHMLNVQSFDGLLHYMQYLAAVRCRDLANQSTTTVKPSSSTNHNRLTNK
ncbi:cartilage matrix protein-like isoform X1 [Haliotis rubra]|uniref:cartilage matrix protein-like isoform X1 n=1 Tax=Haliotis rubra TaxID=36100 RepID=UPI001EE5FD0A|nr:cartilage matrix protein-like isoform X1 [Haliotis rubra]